MELVERLIRRSYVTMLQIDKMDYDFILQALSAAPLFPACCPAFGESAVNSIFSDRPYARDLRLDIALRWGRIKTAGA
jgi:hypothetical protein